MSELADHLGISHQELCFFAFSPHVFYSQFCIAKKNGGLRRIYAPKPKLKSIQRAILEELKRIYRPPSCVYGFVGERNTAKNAFIHVDRAFIVKSDLKDFFQTISSNRVHGLFSAYPFDFDEAVINALTNLVCFKGELPQGAPTSPIISNMICFRMDKALSHYADQHGLKYTRYADDMIFSSTRELALNAVIAADDSTPVRLNQDIEKIIEENGFEVNTSKTGVFSKGTRQVVTGVVVNKKCNFQRADYRYLRSLFHFWKGHGEEEAARYYISGDSHSKFQSRLFTISGDYIEGSLPRHIRGMLDYFSMIAKENKRPSTPLLKLWTSFYDCTGMRVPCMLPERSILRTDSMYSFQEQGEFEPKDKGGTGSAFLLSDGRMVSACHCVRELSNGEYSDYCLDISDGDKLYGIESENAFRYSAIEDWAWMPTPECFADLPELSAADDFSLQKGEKLIAYGYADGKAQLREIECSVAQVAGQLVIVDRALIHGMSGGPVLNRSGKVVGVITQGSGKGVYDRDGRFLLLNAIPDIGE